MDLKIRVIQNRAALNSSLTDWFVRHKPAYLETVTGREFRDVLDMVMGMSVYDACSYVSGLADVRPDDSLVDALCVDVYR